MHLPFMWYDELCISLPNSYYLKFFFASLYLENHYVRIWYLTSIDKLKIINTKQTHVDHSFYLLNCIFKSLPDLFLPANENLKNDFIITSSLLSSYVKSLF